MKRNAVDQALAKQRDTIKAQRARIAVLEIRVGALLELLRDRVDDNARRLAVVKTARQYLDGLVQVFGVQAEQDEVIRHGDAGMVIRKVAELHQRAQNVYEVTGRTRQQQIDAGELDGHIQKRLEQVVRKRKRKISSQMASRRRKARRSR